jgi:hypothetical protein
MFNLLLVAGEVALKANDLSLRVAGPESAATMRRMVGLYKPPLVRFR